MSRSVPRPQRLGRVLALAATVALTLALAPTAQAALRGNPTDKRLASEFLRLLQASDQAGLRSFLDPAFLLQRPDGTWLTRRQYLRNPAVIESYSVSDVHGTRTGDVRVIRYTVQTRQTVDGQVLSQDPVPRLSTYVRSGGAWRLISHANFNAPETEQR